MSTPSVDLFSTYLRVTISPTETHDFHYRWLRHNCDQNRHKTTNERIVDSFDLPSNLTPRSANIENNSLHVTWNVDSRTSTYPFEWLQKFSYSKNRKNVPPPLTDLSKVEIHCENVPMEQCIQNCIQRLNESGFVLVRRNREGIEPAEETEGIIKCFENHGLKVISTHFGYIEDIKTDNTTNKNTDQLGYTNSGVDLHTDQSFLEKPPRYQILQSICCATTGGENYIVDGRAVVEYLKSIERNYFELLCKVKVPFHRKQKAYENLIMSPIIKYGEEFEMVRYSYFTNDPFVEDFGMMEDWYRAYDAFTAIVRNEAYQYRFKLEPGDFILYDNYRMMHARTGFSGPRWVRGIYFDK